MRLFTKVHTLFNQALSVLLFTNGLVVLAGAMLGPIYALYVEKIGGDLLDASMGGAVFALVAGIATLIAGKYSDQMKENELIVAAGYILTGVGYIGFLFAQNVIHVLLLQAVIGLAQAIVQPAFDALYSQHLPRRQEGSAWGVWEAMNYLVTSIGALAGGYIASQWGFSPLFIIMAVMSVVSGAYIVFLPRKVL